MVLNLLALCLLAFSPLVPAEGDESGKRYVADIELQTPEQFRALLERSEQLLLAGMPLPEEGAAVTFVLHGPVLNSLMRGNYLGNKPLVDLAASLSALSVIEVKACNTWMTHHGLDPAGLQPFVEPVSYGPDLVDSLVNEENYLYF